MKEYYIEYIKNIQNSTVKKPSNLIRKWAKDIKQHFTKTDSKQAEKKDKFNIISHWRNTN